MINLKKKTKKQLMFAIPILMIILFIFGIAVSQPPNSKSTIINNEFIPQKQNEITFIFWSACPACFNLEKNLEVWLSNKKHIKVNMIPAAGYNWDFEARMYYSIIKLGNIRAKSIFNQYFNYIHDITGFKTDQMKLNYVSNLLNIKKEDLEKTLYSSDIENDLNYSRNVVKSLKINSVPQIVVNGTHLINMQAFNSYDDLILEIENILRNKK